MSTINDNLINSIIRLRVSIELGLLDNIVTTTNTTNTINSDTNTNTIFNQIYSLENDVDLNNNFENLSNIIQQEINSMSSNIFNITDFMRPSGTTTIITRGSLRTTESNSSNLNNLSGFLFTNIISTLIDPGYDDSDYDEPMPILTEQEFDSLPISKIDKDNSLLNQQCSICLEEFKTDESVVFLKCKHVYHIECIKSWLTKQSSKCPTCRMCCKNT